MRKWFLFFLIAVLVLGVDLTSKAYVHAHIPYLGILSPYFPYGGIGVFQGALGGIDFSVNHVHNTGAAWGAFSSFKMVLLIVRLVVIAGLILYYFVFNKVTGREIPLLMVTMGAIGNVIDYFVYGYVVDFLYFRFWGYSYPLFNVADSVIFCGVALMIIQAYLAKKRENQAHAD